MIKTRSSRWGSLRESGREVSPWLWLHTRQINQNRFWLLSWLGLTLFVHTLITLDWSQTKITRRDLITGCTALPSPSTQIGQKDLQNHFLLMFDRRRSQIPACLPSQHTWDFSILSLVSLQIVDTDTRGTLYPSLQTPQNTDSTLQHNTKHNETLATLHYSSYL